MSFLKFRSTRPNMHTSRVAWERSWEEDLNATYHSGITERLSQARLYPPQAVRQTSVPDQIALSLHEHVRLICELQRDLAKEAAARFSEDDFENTWRSAAGDKRREAIFEGIYQTLSIPDMDERRKFCPDSTLSYLASGQGSAFIEMLKAILPADLRKPLTEPTQIPHPIMDRVLSLRPEIERKPAVIAMNRMMRLFRTYCLTTIMWKTLLAFYGKHEDQLTLKAPRVKPTKTQSDASMIMSAAAVKHHNSLRKQGVYACWFCGKYEQVLGEGKKLMRCSQCNTIDRKVMYCSRECQAKDWKNGKPRPHKDICGRLLSEEDVAQDQDPARSKAVDPRSKYKPPPALLHQMSRLSNRPDIDYWIIPPAPKPDLGISYPASSMEKYLFLQIREKAFVDGDPESVETIFRTLAGHPGLQTHDVRPVDVQKQLEREYGLSLDHVKLGDQT